MNIPLRVLLIEDSEDDALLVLRELRLAGYQPQATRVETREAVTAALLEDGWDLIISDYRLPQFTGLEVLTQITAAHRDTPFILISGAIGEDIAVSAMKAGAHDYLLKGNLARLGPAVERELREANVRSQRRAAERELAQTQENLRQANDKLRAANEKLEQRVAERTAQLRALAAQLMHTEEQERRRVAHLLHEDLQQMLAGARFCLQTIQGRGINAKAQQTLHEVERILLQAIEASRSLTHELCPPILHHSTFDAALEWLGRWYGEQHGLSVQVRCAQPLAIPAEDVRLTLFRVAGELLMNVIKHARTPSATIELAPAPDDTVRLIVSDTGAGFDPLLAREAAKTAGHFGLFHIRERLDSIGGRLEIESAPGQGSRFTVVIPAAALQARAEGEPLPAPKPEKARVLLADDHDVVRDGLRRALTEEPDFEVVGTASDGRQAVDLARQLRPDVVLMDVTMPQLDGVAAARLLTSELPHTKVIALTMHDGDEYRSAMRQAGAVDFVDKSSSVSGIVAVLRRHTGKQPATPSL